MIDNIIAVAVGMLGGMGLGRLTGASGNSPTQTPDDVERPPIDTSPILGDGSTRATSLTPRPDAEPPPAVDGSETEPARSAVNESVAMAVLDVADRVGSDELSRRLADAVDQLDGVAVVRPTSGEPFDPDRHIWADSAPLADGDQAETIERLRTVGLARDDGTTLRPARVDVFDDEM